jgi:hypothetical protein
MVYSAIVSLETTRTARQTFSRQALIGSKLGQLTMLNCGEINVDKKT